MAGLGQYHSHCSSFVLIPEGVYVSFLLTCLSSAQSYERLCFTLFRVTKDNETLLRSKGLLYIVADGPHPSYNSRFEAFSLHILTAGRKNIFISLLIFIFIIV